MDTITLSEIRKSGSKSLPDDRTVYLIVNSKVKSAVVPIRDYEMMIAALEEAEDIAFIKQRKDEESISLDEAYSAAQK